MLEDQNEAMENEEFEEIHSDEVDRVVAPDGSALHLVGMPDPESLRRLDSVLLAGGYEAGSYRERGIDKRRYWKRIGQDGASPTRRSTPP